MVPKIVLFAVLASILALSNGQNDSTVSVPPPEPIPHNKTTTEPPTTTSPTTTTPTPTTTSPNKTTTTTTTTTTSTTPSTTVTTPTTLAPNTTHAPNTTFAPTTSPAPPTTAIPPKPTPEKPEVGTWYITNATNNVTCIMAKMAIQFNITYETTKNTTEYGIFNVPKNSTATGVCGNETQILILSWLNDDNKTNSVNFIFVNKKDHFMISNITLIVNQSDSEVFPDIKDKNVTLYYSNKTEFSTPVSKSYVCAKDQKFGLEKNGTNVTVATIDVSEVQLQAFHKEKNEKFGAAENCESSSSPDIVPIAVGCALVGLVAVVLIAYLVGRRRSQARGYLSIVSDYSESEDGTGQRTQFFKEHA
ncbi:lysosome-associated membrane glycoprotein 1-like isoform X3 [Periplaneta americana]|uniref:lysosome-associated membrane glycoprotein 1-like isoform X3 n=2 Tax=Periplaneta americana TaxID=6978 RepID=UPI0037E95CA0